MGKISNYASALKAKLTDFFVIASNNNGVLETKKVTTEQIGDAVASDQTHSLLDTSDKSLIGGINEVNSNVGTLSSLTTSVKSSLVGAVNEVNSLTDNNLSVATYGGTVYYRKYGHIVEVTATGIGSTTSIAQGDEPILATLPSGYRPKRELNPVGYSRNSFSNARMLGYTIGTNGNIKVYAYEEISNGRFTCSYIVD